MRVLVAANLTPFFKGGAQAHIAGLTAALQDQGHDVECLQLPFAFNPTDEVERAMTAAAALDMTAPSGQSIDRLIALQFPAYAIAHPHAVAWVMHQHRAVYELYEPNRASPSEQSLRHAIHHFDQAALGPLAKSKRLFANSGRVAQRLEQFNGLKAKPLYHPPPDADHYQNREAQDIIFFPSRFEGLKRQLLAIEAMAHVKAPLTLVLAGDGGQFQAAQMLVERMGLQSKVKLLGRVSAAEKLLWMAHAMAVCYPPRDEDYGYVTLEAMLAAKPVITCSDSGGPLEFVQHEQTGWVVEPTPASLAQAFEAAYASRRRAAEMGQAGRALFESKNIRWSHVVETLLAA